MDNTYSCFLIFVFVALILVVLFRCKLKCGTCDNRSENYDFLPTKGSLPTGEGGYLLEGDNLGEFDYVNNQILEGDDLGKFDYVSKQSCLQCMRDYSSMRTCFPYCISRSVI